MRATAQHILVADQEQCEELINQIKEGADFAALAKEHSLCPSGEEGGELGEFRKGMMVKEFDEVVFSNDTPVGEVYPKAVKTQFGYHVIKVTDRQEGKGHGSCGHDGCC